MLTSRQFSCLALVSSLLIVQAFGNTHILQRTSRSTQALNFVVMGDWGGLPVFPYYSPFEIATAHGISVVANSSNSQFVFGLGDNFYYEGVVNEFDPRFQTTFEKVFCQDNLLNIDWFMVAGNHDHNGNVTGQIAYSHHSNRWIFPQMWYQVFIQRPTFNITVVMIDTVILCGNTGADGSLEPQGPENEDMANDQLAYIETALRNATTSQYVLVMGHFPVYSVAEHGPTQCLIDMLNPLLLKYKVSAYFSGHDHNLQHIQDPSSKMNYFVTGAVDVVDPSMKHADQVPDSSVLFHWADILGLGGFATVNVDDKGMVVEFHSAVGSPNRMLYKYLIPPRS